MKPFYARNPVGSATATAVAAAPGCFVMGWDIYNGTGTIIFIQVFNVPAASVTLGTTTPQFVIAVAPGQPNQKTFAVEGIEMIGGFSFGVTTEDDNATEPVPGDITDTIDVVFYRK